MMVFFSKILIKVLLHVLLKIVYSMASEQVISGLVFKLLYALAKKTKTTKDDDFVKKVEDLYHSMSDVTDSEATRTVEKIKILNDKDSQ
ncbi:hypothetical protein XaC1_222 [Xanthomonas phage XaC1]|nr:hypothetical protein XaC1_222 [Xanthomonas phage XaC1]